MDLTHFLRKLVFFVISFWLVAPVFFGVAMAAQSGITVTEQVIDNSSGGGVSGAAAVAAAPGPTPTPTPVPVAVTPPLPTILPVVAPTLTPTPTPEVAPSTPQPTPVSPSTPSAEIIGPTGGAGSGSSSGGGGGGGGFIGGFTQAVTSVTESLTKATQSIIQNSKVIVQEVSRVSGIVAQNTAKVVKSPAGRVATKIAEPIGAVAGGVAVGSQVLVSTMTVTSFSDVYLLIIKMFGLFVGLFRKRRKPWGTVYDSVTKRPLDPAYVVIKKEGGDEVSDAITDLDGRFGFFLPIGKYSMDASKTNYAFPSKQLSGKYQDELYENIYHGDLVENSEGEVIVRNIPLDPVNFDWNEFEKNKQQLFRLYSEKERKWKRAFNYIYNFGFFAALLTAVLDGSYFNYSFLTFYLVIMLYQTFFIWRHTAVTLKYADSGEPIPYSIVKLFSAEANNEVKSVVTDQLGRFYLLVGQGKYYLTVDAKQPDASYKRIYQSEVMDLKNGIVPSDIIVPSIPKDYEPHEAKDEVKI